MGNKGDKDERVQKPNLKVLSRDRKPATSWFVVDGVSVTMTSYNPVSIMSYNLALQPNAAPGGKDGDN